MATIDQIRAKAAEIDDAVEQTAQTAKQGVTLLVVAVVLLAILGFVLGRRGSKKVVVEVRRR